MFVPEERNFENYLTHEYLRAVETKWSSAVLYVLAEVDGPMSSSEIGREIDVITDVRIHLSSGQVNGVCAQLKRDGFVETEYTNRRKMYTITEKGKALLGCFKAFVNAVP